MRHKQRTIKTHATIRGIGLQTGKSVRIRLKSAPTDTGIVFIRTDLPGAPAVKAAPSGLKETGRVLQRTVIRDNKAEVHTVEHLLATLSAFYIDNIFIEIDGAELPGLDGSSKEFAAVLSEAGTHEQEAPRRYIEIDKPIICTYEKGAIQIIPDERFRIEYFLDYDHPFLRDQWFDITLDGSDSSTDFFRNEIAPSRTFCRESEALALLKAGLGKGADVNNTLVIGKEGPIDNAFRFTNEPARHKLLDLIGDLYILGRHIKGRIVAKKSGHKLNNIFTKRLQEEMDGRHRSDTEDNASSLSNALSG